jgi:hypothetical protein
MNKAKSKHSEKPLQHPIDGLTCSEGQVEDLLSKGESTETESEEDSSPQKPRSRSSVKMPAKKLK